jgi:phosphate starvation-inducible protein PhoH
MICGDRKQSDKGGGGPKAVWKLLNITERMRSFSHVDFKEQDIVRSGFVKEFLLAVNAEEKEEKRQRDADRIAADFIRESHRQVVYKNGSEALLHP